MDLYMQLPSAHTAIDLSERSLHRAVSRIREANYNVSNRREAILALRPVVSTHTIPFCSARLDRSYNYHDARRSMRGMHHERHALSCKPCSFGRPGFRASHGVRHAQNNHC